MNKKTPQTNTPESKEARHLGDLEWEEVVTALRYFCDYGGISIADAFPIPRDGPEPYNLLQTLEDVWKQAKERRMRQRQIWKEIDEDLANTK